MSYGEHRTVHLGVDLFAPAGTAVLAPLDGVVHAVADNRASARLRSGGDSAASNRCWRHLLHGLRTPRSRIDSRTEVRTDNQHSCDDRGVGNAGGKRRLAAAPPFSDRSRPARSLNGLSRCLPRDRGGRLECALAGSERDSAAGVGAQPFSPATAPTAPAASTADLYERRRRSPRSKPERRLPRSDSRRPRVDAIPVRHDRPPISGRVQQCAARRARPFARRSGRRRADAGAQHEHAISARHGRAVCRTPDGYAARSAPCVLLRELRQRSERARPAPRADLHPSARDCGSRGRLPRQHFDARGHQPVQVQRTGRRGAAAVGTNRARAGRVSRRIQRRCRSEVRGEGCGGRGVTSSEQLRRGRVHRGECAERGRTDHSSRGLSPECLRGRSGCRWNLHRGRGANRFRSPWPQLLCVRNPTSRPRHRRPRQTDRQRASHGCGDHHAGDCRVVRQRDGILQHVRRKHCLVRGWLRRARRAG